MHTYLLLLHETPADAADLSPADLPAGFNRLPDRSSNSWS